MSEPTIAEAMGEASGELLAQALKAWIETGAPVGGGVFVMGPAGTVAEVIVSVRTADPAHVMQQAGAA